MHTHTHARAHTHTHTHTHQLHQVPELAYGFRKSSQLVVAGVEDAQWEVTQAGRQCRDLVPAEERATRKGEDITPLKDAIIHSQVGYTIFGNNSQGVAFLKHSFAKGSINTQSFSDPQELQLETMQNSAHKRLVNNNDITRLIHHFCENCRQALSSRIRKK